MQGIAAISFALVLGVFLHGRHPPDVDRVRTRGMLEPLLGGMLLLTAGIGYPFQILEDSSRMRQRTPALLLGYVGLSAGVALLTCSLGCVRGQEKWARVFVGPAS